MSHAEKHLEMPDEMKRISGLAKLLVEKGELKLGCDFEKDILPKLSMSETSLIILKWKIAFELTPTANQPRENSLKLIVKMRKWNSYGVFQINQSGFVHWIQQKQVVQLGEDVLVIKSNLCQKRMN